MKGFVTVTLFFIFALICIKAGNNGTVLSTVSMEECAVQYTSAIDKNTVNPDAIISLDRGKGIADMEVSDAHNLAHRISASAERMYRFSSIETSQFIKTLLRRMADRIANLANCHTHVYDTSRCLSWDGACEHYIFGMRRILI